MLCLFNDEANVSFSIQELSKCWRWTSFTL